MMDYSDYSIEQIKSLTELQNLNDMNRLLDYFFNKDLERWLKEKNYIDECHKVHEEETLYDNTDGMITIEFMERILGTLGVTQTDAWKKNCQFWEAALCLQEKEYQQAIAIYENIAKDTNNSSAAFALGEIYKQGIGVEQDYVKAKQWYEKAVSGRNGFAQSSIGSFYLHSRGVKKDYEKARTWFQIAAEQGNRVGQNNLGYMYDIGLGVKKDYKKAVEYYRQSAEQGSYVGKYSLGTMYEYGTGVEKDYKKAFSLYEESAACGYARAQNNTGFFYMKGYGVEQDYTKAMKWYQKAAKQDYHVAQHNIGILYEKGRGVEADIKKALKWYKKAAQNDYFTSQKYLGDFYFYHKNVDTDEDTDLHSAIHNQDYVQAYKWYQMAANNKAETHWARNSVLANLGTICENGGWGMEPNFSEALMWYETAAKSGHIYMQIQLGKMYEEGQKVEKNISEAKKWYQMAADSNILYAKIKLQNMENGNWAKKDEDSQSYKEILPKAPTEYMIEQVIVYVCLWYFDFIEQNAYQSVLDEAFLQYQDNFNDFINDFLLDLESLANNRSETFYRSMDFLYSNTSSDSQTDINYVAMSEIMRHELGNLYKSEHVCKNDFYGSVEEFCAYFYDEEECWDYNVLRGLYNGNVCLNFGDKVLAEKIFQRFFNNSFE